MSLKTVGTRSACLVRSTLLHSSNMKKQVGAVAASVIQNSSQSHATSAIVDAKLSKLQAKLLGESKCNMKESDFPEVKDDSLEGDDGDMSLDDIPEIVIKPSKPIILPPGSLAKSVLRVFKSPKLILAVPIRYAFKDQEEISVAKSYASAEILRTSVVRTNPSERVEQNQPRKSFWGLLKNALGFVGAAFTAAGGLVAYYVFPSKKLSNAV
jgi:hypothetical protein